MNILAIPNTSALALLRASTVSIQEPAVEIRSSFSRAAQKEFTEKAAEQPESSDNAQNKNRNKDRQISL